MMEYVDAAMPDGPVLRIVVGESGIRAIEFPPPRTRDAKLNGSNPLLVEAERQLRAYFAGDLSAFDLPLEPEGTEFQKRVWSELGRIPYGETRSYMEIAQAMGAPRAVRAVGAANGSNPLPIVVPCHRVIGAGGKLVGYGGGMELKRKLLDLEAGRARLFQG